jgi:hypothetical protein
MAAAAWTIFALAVPVALGWVSVRLLMPAPATIPDRIARSALSVGLGLGLSSCLYFVWLASGARSSLLLAAIELGTLAAGVVLLKRRAAPRSPAPPAAAGAPPGRTAGWVLGAALGVAGALAAHAFWFVYRAQPHGAWDAFAMYNARARFFVRAGERWSEAFAISPLFHPDYPALLPSSVARIWTYTGDESTLAPALVAFLFVVATVSLLAGALASRRGPASAVLAVVLACGLATVQYGNDSLVLLASLQLADVPFAFFLLAAVVLATPDGRGPAPTWAAAGLAAALGAWCKNEGTLLGVVLIAAIALVAVLERRPAEAGRRLVATLLGGAPVFALLVVYRVWIAPPGEIVSDSNVGVLAKIATPERYAEIGSQVLGAVIAHGRGAWLAFGLTIAVIGLRPRSERLPNALPIVTVVALWLGYLAVYVITPHELAWHVVSSKHRLLTQVWPAALFAGLLLARSTDVAFERDGVRGTASADDASLASR